MKSVRTYWKTLLLATFLLLVAKNYAQTTQKPNLLFIITDQQRYDAMSIAGNTILKTPNLDRLAKQGARFKNAYTPCAVCGPARASILTGRTVENHGILTNTEADSATPQSATIMPQKTFDQILTEQFGYKAEYYGKWHAPEFAANCYTNPIKVSKSGRSIFGSNGDIRFYKDNYLDLVFPKPAITSLKPNELYDTFTERPYVPNILDKRYGKTQAQVDASGTVYAQPDLHGVITIPDEQSLTAFRARQTMEALERLKNTNFSITASFHIPHAPMLPSKYYSDMYPISGLTAPVSISDPMTNSPYKKSNSRETLPEYADANKIKYLISDYYALVTEVDDWIGKILDKVDQLGLTNNTLIIFTSDHGENLGAHGMREKNVFYEEAAHVPTLISFPGKIAPNTVVDGYVSNVDLFATINDYLQIPEQPSDGKSLRGLIEGTNPNQGKYVVTEWHSDPTKWPSYMIVKGDWKMLIPSTATSTVIDALYNLKDDPYEMNNLMGSNPNKSNYTQKINELHTDLLTWLKKNNSKKYDGVLNRNLTGTPLTLSTESHQSRTCELKVFPNPTSKYLIIDSKTERIDGLEIYDSNGRLVYSEKTSFTGSKKIEIDLKPGIYLIKAKSDCYFAPQKIIIK
ncbi:sulfatase-like hydrolase/transferase [Flavobacterium nackdongense]|uniref:T9SS type A sorting domain-containing protein n=1 Tax=Flavobacterium nackdongense TaxID=2547394 RepID=A0A4P6YC79_9FLAO|nr:sulfatase-like hydrolase/transferase [Flavobacterium nackdongense]QBN17903.1 T9SS type A sorting domain-containing protein [Flavobacterium nackdongense]